MCQADFSFPCPEQGLKPAPLSKLVHTADRQEIMKRYARAVCNVLAVDATFDQIDWIKAYFSTMHFLPEVIDSIDGQIKEAASKPESKRIQDALQEMNYTTLKYAGARIISDLARAAAAAEFPSRQVETIKTFARGMGLNEEHAQQFLDVAEKEQRLLFQNVVVPMAA